MQLNDINCDIWDLRVISVQMYLFVIIKDASINRLFNIKCANHRRRVGEKWVSLSFIILNYILNAFFDQNRYFFGC